MPPAKTEPIFVTGGTGYIGRPLIRALTERGHQVHGLIRRGSEAKLPTNAIAVIGDALDESTFADAIPKAATLVHLVGTPHPRPAEAAEFQRVDLVSIRASTAATRRADVRHLVYVRVAHHAPVMRAYVGVRQRGEALVIASGIPATILRPWYVLGSGHRWPYVLIPIYAVLRRLSATRESASSAGKPRSARW